MTLDVVNTENEKVGALEIRDEVLGGGVNTHIIWEAVVHAQALTHRGTHATKNRAMVSGTGKKPWRQKGTGRARVGESRNPLWRKGGTVFGPQPRDYGYALPRKIQQSALRAALSQKLLDGVVTVVDQLALGEAKTKHARELLDRLGAGPKTLLVDLQPEQAFVRSIRNLTGVRLVPSGRLTARDVMDTKRVIVTRAAVERLQEVLGL